MSVRTDVINLNVNVNGNAAQNQLNQLRKSAADVKFEMDGLKKGTEAYIAKKKELAGITDEMTKLKQQIGITSLNMRELNSEIARIKSIQNNITPGTAEWKKYNEELQLAINRQQEIKGQSAGFGEGASRISEIAKGFTIGNIVAEGAEKLLGGIRDFFGGIVGETEKADLASKQLQNTLEGFNNIKTLPELKNQAEELHKQFSFLAEHDILTVQDKLITFGKLTTAEIKKLLPVIIDYAAKTGKDLPQAADDFTRALEGNGREMKKMGVIVSDTNGIAKNLGIIMTDLRQRVNGAAETFGESTQGKIASFRESIKDAQKSIGEFFEELISPKSANKLFDEAKLQTDNYNESLKSLLIRYDELKGKTTLNKDEQNELRGIIEKIVEIVPNAATEFNKYGEALDINKEKVQSFITVSKEILAQKEFKAIDESVEKIKDNINKIARINAQIQEGIKPIASGGTGGAAASFVKLTNDDLREMQANMIALKQDAVNTAETLKNKFDFALSPGLQKIIGSFEGFLKGAADIKLPEDSDADKKAKAERQKELDDKTKKEREALYDSLLNKATEFDKKLRDLQQQSEDASKTKNQKELDDVTHKYAEILIEYHKLVKEFSGSGIHLQFDEKDIQNLKNNEIAGLLLKQRQEQEDKAARESIKLAEEEYQKALQLSDNFFAEQKKQRTQAYIKGDIDEKQYNSDIASIEVLSQQNRLTIAQDYAGQKTTILENGVKKEVALVKTADEDVTKFKKGILDKQTADELDAFKKREANRKLFEALQKESELSHAKAQVALARVGTDAALKAQENLLRVQHQQRLRELEIERTDLLKAAGDDGALKIKINNEINQEIADENAQFNKSQEQLKIDAIVKDVQQYLSYAQQVLDIFKSIADIKTNRENADLEADKKRNDQKKNNYKKQLDNKLLSEAQYNLKVAALDEELDKEEKEIRRAQAKREKTLRLFQAIINTAAGIATGLSEGGIPGAIIAAAIGAIQIALIAATPLPELGRGDWLRKGDKHSDPSRGIPAYIERDEAVMSAAAMNDKRIYRITGNAAQITSALNGRNGGANWAGGANLVEMASWRTDKPAGINPNLPAIMEQGGIVRNIEGVSNSTNGTTDFLLKQLIKEQQRNTEAIENTQTKLHAIVSIKEFRIEEAKYDAAKKASGLNT